jgi:hypothetical protein
LGQFTRDLQAGRVKKGFTYRRGNFYKIVLHRLIDFGFIGVFTHGSKYYGPIWQPIPKRGPGGHNWWNLAYLVAKKWNERFWGKE